MYEKLSETQFQISVWEEIKKIPSGEKRTYKAIANLIAGPNAFRAVGNAVAKNPFPLIISCHRLVRSDGKKRLGLLLKNEKKHWFKSVYIMNFNRLH